MKKPGELLIILIIILCIVGLGIWHVVAEWHDKSLTLHSFQATSQKNLKDYQNSEFGFNFSYPADYVLSESTTQNASSSYQTALVRTEDNLQPPVGEGPRAITVEVFKNQSDIFKWLNTNPASNWQISNHTYASATVDSSVAIQYSWQGLYNGRTTVFEHLGNIIALSVTYDAPTDAILLDYNDLLNTIKLSERTLTKDEAVEMVAAKYPEVKKFLETSLPPTSVEVIPYNDGIHSAVIFKTSGSGVPYLLSAKCFDISTNGQVSLTGEYKINPKDAYKPKNVSARGCLPLGIEVTKYISDHINDLSPIKASLGGKFYATNIELAESGEAGQISYEDGHNVYRASFNYSSDPNYQNIKITNFKLLP
ncbi:MAG TPA: hypothetical protein VFA52_00620 [Candidatus Paceibacterota bacterium]|nr:hypothetical protein [Candidatus Paceibacterota bacterium]